MALRVLVDATGVPADRGALGRYVDGLIGAVGTTGIELAVACQLSDEDRYRRLAPEAAIVAGPVGLGHRTERLAWEQSGLPLVAQRVSADVLHIPYYSMPLRPGLPWMLTRTHRYLASVMAQVRDPNGFARLAELAAAEPASSQGDAKIAATLLCTPLPFGFALAGKPYAVVASASLVIFTLNRGARRKNPSGARARCA